MQEEEDQINEDKLVRGGFISLLKNIKMRLFKTCFMDKVCNIFVEIFDFLSRK